MRRILRVGVDIGWLKLAANRPKRYTITRKAPLTLPPVELLIRKAETAGLIQDRNAPCTFCKRQHTLGEHIREQFLLRMKGLKRQ